MKRALPQQILTTPSVSHNSAEAGAYHTGQLVWVSCLALASSVATMDQAYVKCNVKEIHSDGSVTVDLLDYAHSTVVTSQQHIYVRDEAFGLNDNAELKSLNYPNVLENIRHRFNQAAAHLDQKHKIYTFAGWILFAVNPYSPCYSIYDDRWCQQYYGKTITQTEPHPFAIASHAFSRLINDRKSQYILISGESGGGKTECSKHILKYLTWVTRKQRRARGRVSVGGPGDAAETLAQLLIASSPILEFFGNAKTSRNDNSSRFGKLFQIFYDQNGDYLLTAHLSTYLLAKSRVVQVPEGEENYHIFHSLVKAYNDGKHDWLPTIDTKCFKSPYLGETQECSSYYRENGDFHIDVLLKALDEFRISREATAHVFKVLIAILMLGLLKFEPVSSGGCVASNFEVIEEISALLGIAKENTNRLQEVLTSKQIRDTRSLLDTEQSKRMTHSLAKGLYESVFHYILHLVRQRLEQEHQNFSPAGRSISEDRCVGVLDLFGFENMEPGSQNGFEQLCINYANEQLHFHFMKEVVEKEKEIYKQEGLGLHVQFSSQLDSLFTSEALACLLGSNGVFALLEEATALGKSDRDDAFCRRANQVILEHKEFQSPHKKKRANINLESNRGMSEKFTIEHYAEPVTYTAAGFAARNQDHLSDELRSFLLSSTGPHVRAIMVNGGNQEELMGNVKKAKSLSAVFVRQMAALISGLEQTSCLFVKCLKPNDLQKPFIFNQARILKQLITGGVGPVLEVMKCGYPCRLSYTMLWERYKDFLPEGFPASICPKDFAEMAIRFLAISDSQYRLGVSRVFFKLGALQQIEKLMTQLPEKESADVISQMYRHWLKMKVHSVFQAAHVVCRLRALLRRVRYKRLAREAAHAYVTVYVPRRRRWAALVIVKHMAAMRDRIRYLKIKKAVCVIQAAYRQRRLLKRITTQYKEEIRLRQAKRVAAIVTAAFLKKESKRRQIAQAATKIQAAWRGFKTRQHLKILSDITISKAATKIQTWWRRVRRNRRPRRVSVSLTPTPAGSRRTIVPPVCLRQRRGSTMFNNMVEHWEVTMLTAGQTPDVKKEVVRRRRSLFTTEIGRPFYFPASAQNSIESPRFGSDVSEELLQLKPPHTTGVHTNTHPLDTHDTHIKTPRIVPTIETEFIEPASQRPRSRRAIQSGRAFGGLDSAAVVDIFAQALESERELIRVSPKSQLTVPTPVAEEENVMGNCLRGVSQPQRQPETKPVLDDLTQHTTADTLAVTTSSDMESFIPEATKSNDPSFGRLSIRAWREAGPMPSISDITMQGVNQFLKGEKANPWFKMMAENIAANMEEDTGSATPLFGAPKTRDSDLSDLLIPEGNVSGPKDLTPRPNLKSKTKIPAFKKPLGLGSAPKGDGAGRSRIPQRPMAGKGKEVRVITIGSKQSKTCHPTRRED